jgi:hypothetical protein
LNLIYAPEGTILDELSDLLSEDLSHILIWTKSDTSSLASKVAVDLVELPRLQLSFYSKQDSSGTVRLYSSEYVGMFISNARSEKINSLLDGVPHALVLENIDGDLAMVAAAISPTMLTFLNGESEPELLFYTRQPIGDTTAVSHYIYPIHLSKSFLFTPTIQSAMYLMLLRMLHKQYQDAFQLAESCISDIMTSSKEASHFWTLIQDQTDDMHPNAHALRLKLCYVALSVGYPVSWDLTSELSNYISKFGSLSAICRLSAQEEYYLLQQVSAKDYKLLNRTRFLELMLNGDQSMTVTYPPRAVLQHEFDTVVDKTCMAIAGESFFSKFSAVSYKRPDEKTTGALLATAVNKWLDNGLGLHGGKDDLGFLFLYELMTGSLNLQLAGTDDPYPYK